jgi:uncharacterized protein with von Willebrand factor type A (vWA) domain
MQSHKLDETRPTLMTPDEQFMPKEGEPSPDNSTNVNQEADTSVTQRIAISQTEEHSISETQPSQFGDAIIPSLQMSQTNVQERRGESIYGFYGLCWASYCWR